MWEVLAYGERPYWNMTNRDVSRCGVAWWQACLSSCPYPSQPSRGGWEKRTQRAALPSSHTPAGMCTVCLSPRWGHQCVAHRCSTQPFPLQHLGSLLCLAVCALWVSPSLPAALYKPFCWLESFSRCCDTFPIPWKGSGLP